MSVSNSLSDSDGQGGCLVGDGGQLTMDGVTVNGVTRAGKVS